MSSNGVFKVLFIGEIDLEAKGGYVTRIGHVGGLEGDEEGLEDVLFKLETSFHVLFSPGVAAARKEETRDHVPIFIVMPSSQQSNVNSNSSAQQDDLILSVIQQLKTQVANYTKTNMENKSANDTLTAELERYKEQVKVLKEGQNVDLRKHLKEKESLLQTVTLLKNDFKKEESRNIDREIALEKQIKHLDNISKPKLYVGDIIVQTNPIVIPDSEESLTLAEESHSKMLLKHKDNMMLEKKRQVDTTPIDYAALNDQLYKDFS
ncbi:hypothetical protein Tco_0972775 [Tanacetum coccineum]